MKKKFSPQFDELYHSALEKSIVPKLKEALKIIQTELDTWNKSKPDEKTHLENELEKEMQKHFLYLRKCKKSIIKAIESIQTTYE